jgi:HAD superfamily phosphatase (TIGR01668 family)
VFRFFAPHLSLDSVADLTATNLERLGRKALLLDIDGTLKAYRSERVAPETVAWIESLKHADIRLCLVSNGKHHRIERIAQELRVPFVAQAFKPFPFRCRAALRKIDVIPEHAAMIGDQLFADILAGRLAGMLTILVRPMSLDEPCWTRIKRPFERFVLNRTVRRSPSAAARSHCLLDVHRS